VGAVQGVAERQKAHAGAPIAGRPLVAGQVMTPQVSGMLCAQAPLVVNVLHIALDKREGFVHLPRPVRRVDTLPTWTPRHTPVPPQDVTDGVGRQGYPVPLQVQRQATSPQTRLLTCLQYRLLPRGRGLAGRSMRTAGAVFQPCLPLRLVARDPFAYHLT
jgi:hypothetical protein